MTSDQDNQQGLILDLYKISTVSSLSEKDKKDIYQLYERFIFGYLYTSETNQCAFGLLVRLSPDYDLRALCKKEPENKIVLSELTEKSKAMIVASIVIPGLKIKEQVAWDIKITNEENICPIELTKKKENVVQLVKKLYSGCIARRTSP